MTNLSELSQKVKEGLRADSVYPVRAMGNMINATLNEVEQVKRKSYTDLAKKAELIAEGLFFEYGQKEQIDFLADYDRVSTSVLAIPGTPNTKVTVSFEYLGDRGFGFICLPVLFDLHRHEAELSLINSKELPEPTVIEVGKFYCSATLCSSESAFDVLFSCVHRFGKMLSSDNISEFLRRWFIRESEVSYEILQEIHGDKLPDRVLKLGLQDLVDKGFLEYDMEEDTYCLTNHTPAGELGY